MANSIKMRNAGRTTKSGSLKEKFLSGVPTLISHRVPSVRFSLLVMVTTSFSLWLLFFGNNSVASGAEISEPVPEWIWTSKNRQKSGTVYFRKTVSFEKKIQKATLYVVADFCHTSIFFNGKHSAEVADYGSRLQLDVTKELNSGENLIAIQANGSSGPSAVAVRLDLLFEDKSQQTIVTDNSWLSSTEKFQNWQGLKLSDVEAKKWTAANSFGELAEEPWRNIEDRIAISKFDDYTQWKQALDTKVGADPSRFYLPEGFEIERLRSATAEEDSWVSLAVDPQGRFIIAKEQKGLLRMTLADDGSEISKVETINDTLLECRGLLFVEKTLFVNANNSKGLYRLRDTNGDDQFDEVKLLYESGGSVGHGRNDLTLGPDGMVYSIHGDAVELPDNNKNFFDRTSPFREARKGLKTREGHVIRFNPDGTGWEIVCSGLRNPFGIDFNNDGEMFTYDADAEYDMGSPWYRPTRVDHLVSGGDFGWRGVTGSWPTYYPDHPDNALPNFDIGKGSPTAVKFGYQSQFPEKYQQALFILDWAYGRILAVHMTPRGGSYAMNAETFVKGRPFNVTDLDFGADGAMYVVTGGRKTQAALYRIRYVDSNDGKTKPTAQQKSRAKYSRQSRSVRKKLEAFHGQQNSKTIDVAWPYLDSTDPWIRHAARIAIEHQPVERWRQRAFSETKPTAAVTALMALARAEIAADQSAILTRLNDLPIAEFSPEQKQAAFYAYELCLKNSQESKKLDPSILKKTSAKLETRYPDLSKPADVAYRINRRLGALLVLLDAPNVVRKTMGLLAKAESQKEQLQYLYLVRNVKEGWSPDDRRLYFSTLAQSRFYVSGQGMPDFLKRIREESIATLSDNEKEELSQLLKESDPTAVTESEPLPERKIVNEWKTEELLGELAGVDSGRNFEQGQRMFAAALCVRCHRVGARGLAIGPDLTSVSSRFSRRDILESIINPSKVVAEKFRNVQVVTDDGKVYVGRVVLGGDYRSPKLRMATDVLHPLKITEIEKQSIESYQLSPVSAMPKGLLNTLTREEILDLLAYLESAGNKKHRFFSE